MDKKPSPREKLKRLKLRKRCEFNKWNDSKCRVCKLGIIRDYRKACPLLGARRAIQLAAALSVAIRQTRTGGSV